MSTALPSTAGTPQPTGLHNQVTASPAQAFAQAQIQQQQLQAQSLFRQKQLMAQKQQHQSSGQAVLRLLQFAEQLSPGEKEAENRSFWDNFVDTFFTSSSVYKLGLLNTVDNEQKAF
ncbi:hypothetical protein CU098_002891, partial [Rhizopus stolonifer]